MFINPILSNQRTNNFVFSRTNKGKKKTSPSFGGFADHIRKYHKEYHVEGRTAFSYRKQFYEGYNILKEQATYVHPIVQRGWLSGDLIPNLKRIKQMCDEKVLGLRATLLKDENNDYSLSVMSNQKGVRLSTRSEGLEFYLENGEFVYSNGVQVVYFHNHHLEHARKVIDFQNDRTTTYNIKGESKRTSFHIPIWMPF